MSNRLLCSTRTDTSGVAPENAHCLANYRLAARERCSNNHYIVCRICYCIYDANRFNWQTIETRNKSREDSLTHGKEQDVKISTFNSISIPLYF